MDEAIAAAAPEAGSARRAGLPAWARHAAKFALGAVAIWALVRAGALDPALVARACASHPGICTAAFGTYAGVVLVAWLRWHLLLRVSGLAVPPGRSFRLQMVGLFFNSLLPGGTGGDLVKGYYLFQDQGQGRRALALTSIAMDRFVGFYGILTVAMAMTALNYALWKDHPVLRLNSLFYAGVFAGFTLAVAFFFSPFSRVFLEHPAWHRLPGGRFLKSLSDALAVYRRRPAPLLAALALTFAVDLGLVLLYWLCGAALEVDLPLLGHGFVVPTLTMVNGIPISPAGVGVGEAAGEFLYRNLGVREGGSELLALVHLCVIAASLAAAPFYFMNRARAARRK